MTARGRDRHRQIAGQRAIVTGGSSGLGRSLARELAARGARVLATARRRGPLEELAAEVTSRGGRIEVVAGDITDAGFRDSLPELATERLGGLDLLVLAAGRGAVGPFAGASPQTLRDVMELDFFAPAELVRRSLPSLRRSADPCLLVIGSILGRWPLPEHLEYSAAKAAIASLADGLRMELAPEGIGVTLATLGPLESSFWENLVAGRRAGWSRGRPMPVGRAAARIVRAVEHRRDELTPGWNAKAYLLASRWMPRILQRMVIRHVSRFGG
jgi:short-subunit dehydrogenase